jgi:hypothetical protein
MAMRNVKLSVQGSILTIEVDLAKDLGPSSTGKTILVASTKGLTDVPGVDGVMVGLNVVRPKSSAAPIAA